MLTSEKDQILKLKTQQTQCWLSIYNSSLNHLRYWPNIEPAVGEHVLFAEGAALYDFFITALPVIKKCPEQIRDVC